MVDGAIHHRTGVIRDRAQARELIAVEIVHLGCGAVMGQADIRMRVGQDVLIDRTKVADFRSAASTLSIEDPQRSLVRSRRWFFRM